MSRALEPELKKALHPDANHAAVFYEVSRVLTTPNLLQIEILGHYLFEFCHDAEIVRLDGNAVAIPKVRLLQAFLHARRIFVAQPHRDQLDLMLRATAVMLLFDPEHLTAANARKRLISIQDLDPEDGERLLWHEKLFVDSLLTSYLHRHSKSPNLWSHRRWLMEHMRKRGTVTDPVKDLRDRVLVSAMRHPRNYYAWNHARYLAESVEPGSNSWSSILAETVKWCRCHHDDVSGWMFLALLLEGWPARAGSVLADVLKLTKSLRWRNESVWYFLRNVMADPRVEGTHRERFDSTLRTVRGETDAGSPDREVLDRTSIWMQNYPSRP
ncbi:hypothetical protein XA68_16022 [Ophiocordyceps unilateralis]|uniref:Protein prenyltransferase n=1 Tax=Ophiocordyceps unilateralis TaxID=268505 RepID=A0A2A9P6F3_OPHUN|nr:hypothetical protein XA68_16022 [Ophiocordyceps unilateralis]